MKRSQFGQCLGVSGNYTDDLHQPLDGLLRILQKLIAEAKESRTKRGQRTGLHSQMNSFQAAVNSRDTQTSTYNNMLTNRSILISRIQVCQLVHDLGTVPQNGMELQEALQSLLQTIQSLIG